MALPGIIIPTDAAVKLPFGIESVASEIVEGDGRWEMGVVAQQPICGPASPYPSCFSFDPEGSPAPPEDSPGVKTFDEGIDTVENGAFAVYSGSLCTPVGGFWDRAMARSREGLITGRERALELEMATGTTRTGQFLTSADTVDVTPTPGTPVTLTQGIALLEEWAGANSAGRGALLGNRRDILMAASDHVIVEPTPGQQTLFTFLNTPVAALSGFDGRTGPDGEPAGDGEAWLFMLGSQPRIWRSGIIEIPRDESVELGFNNQYALTEQVFNYAWQCGTAAVLVTSV